MTEGRLEEKGLDESEGRAGCRGTGESRSHERLLDARRSPDYLEQRALDQLLAPVLTKALLQGGYWLSLPLLPLRQDNVTYTVGGCGFYKGLCVFI